MPIEERRWAGPTWQSPILEGEEAHTRPPLQAAVVAYRIAFGARAGRKVRTLKGAKPREPEARQPTNIGEWCFKFLCSRDALRGR